MSWAARTEQREDAGSLQSGEPLGATEDGDGSQPQPRHLTPTTTHLRPGARGYGINHLVGLLVMLGWKWRAKTERCKDAGSVNTGVVLARPRTPQRDGLQPPEQVEHCEKAH